MNALKAAVVEAVEPGLDLVRQELKSSREDAMARIAALETALTELRAAVDKNGVDIRENSANFREAAADARETRRRIEKLPSR